LPNATKAWGVDFVDALHGWVVGGSGRILKTVDGGATWTAQTSGTSKDLLELSFADANNGWAAGQMAGILHTSDGGATWTRQATKLLTEELTTVAALDADRCWAASGYPSTLYRTLDGGAHWTAVSIGRWQNIEALEFPTPDVGWAVGWHGTILRTASRTE